MNLNSAIQSNRRLPMTKIHIVLPESVEPRPIGLMTEIKSATGRIKRMMAPVDYTFIVHDSPRAYTAYMKEQEAFTQNEPSHHEHYSHLALDMSTDRHRAAGVEAGIEA